MNWFELSVKVSANESVPVSLPTIYYSVQSFHQFTPWIIFHWTMSRKLSPEKAVFGFGVLENRSSLAFEPWSPYTLWDGKPRFLVINYLELRKNLFWSLTLFK